MEKRCYTVEEIQDILRISRPSVYELIKDGKFVSFKIAGKYRINKESFDAWFSGEEKG